MDFKSLLYLFICVTYPAIFIFILSCFVPVAPFLANSISTPWGIVTCIFVHVSQAHLYSNILLLALYLATFAFINIYHSRSTRVRKSSFLIYSSVLSALLANAFCLLINPREVSVGASGMVFAVEGAVFASALSNIASAPTFVSKLPSVRHWILTSPWTRHDHRCRLCHRGHSDRYPSVVCPRSSTKSREKS